MAPASTRLRAATRWRWTARCRPRSLSSCRLTSSGTMSAKLSRRRSQSSKFEGQRSADTPLFPFLFPEFLAWANMHAHKVPARCSAHSPGGVRRSVGMYTISLPEQTSWRSFTPQTLLRPVRGPHLHSRHRSHATAHAQMCPQPAVPSVAWSGLDALAPHTHTQDRGRK